MFLSVSTDQFVDVVLRTEALAARSARMLWSSIRAAVKCGCLRLREGKGRSILAGATGFWPGQKRKQKHGRVQRHILMRLIAKASSFICSILLCGVGLYFFANKPWFYVSAVYCCCGQRQVELRGLKTISKRQ